MSNYCMYCDDPLRNNPFKFGYSERKRALLWGQPWRYYHKVPMYGTEENFVGSWVSVWYERQRCTK